MVISMGSRCVIRYTTHAAKPTYQMAPAVHAGGNGSNGGLPNISVIHSVTVAVAVNTMLICNAVNAV